MRVEPEYVEQFADLFEGRRDAYGTENGGCARQPDGWPIWKSTLANHLSGDSDPIGVYPMVPSPLFVDGNDVVHHMWELKWGCVDFDIRTPTKPAGDYADTRSAHEAAIRLQQTTRALGLYGYVEQSRSGGYHLWVFAEEWVSAEQMRHALMAACKAANVSAREVNPKNTGYDDPSTLGNYVRLPYPGHNPEGRRMFVSTMDGRVWRLGEFLAIVRKAA